MGMKKECNVFAGNLVRERQRELNYHNVDAGAKIGMSKKAYENLCAGKTDFHLDTMLLIDKEFGLSPNMLAYGSDEAPARVDFKVAAGDFLTAVEAIPNKKEISRKDINSVIMRLLNLSEDN